MKFFSILTKLLHYLPGEFSHHLALKSLKLLHISGLTKWLIHNQKLDIDYRSRDIRKLKNKVGIAAGLDKNGDYIDCLASLGVSFIEVGTVTPKAQKGNPKPRIFRNIEDKSLVNKLGFNNKGVDYLVERLKKRNSNILLGSSIGKNFNTPNNEASDDYVFCLKRVYEYSDYIAINISSPNTEDLRDLGTSEYLNSFLSKIKTEHSRLVKMYGYKPIYLKISPDESLDNLKSICDAILENELDGLICSNTTIDHNCKNGSGGLSGAPLRQKATETLKSVKSLSGDRIPIIASGGVMSAEDYQEKLDAGADLVQIYTGFIYEGPKLIQDILNHSSD